MEDMNLRFKLLREKLGLSQESMGEIIGVKRSGVSNIESGMRNVNEKHIKLLCVKPIKGKIISEDFLRTGSGDMFKTPPEEDETAAYVSELLEEVDNPLYGIIKEIMHTYQELDPKSQEVIRDFSAQLRENLEKKKEG